MANSCLDAYNDRQRDSGNNQIDLRDENGNWLPQLRQNPLFWGGFRCSWCDGKEDPIQMWDIEPGDGFCYQSNCRSFPQLRRWVDEAGSDPTDTEARHEDEQRLSITAAELDLLFDKEQDLCKIDRTQSRQSHHDVNKNRQITEERAQELAQNRPESYSRREEQRKLEREEQKRLDDEGRFKKVVLARADRSKRMNRHFILTYFVESLFLSTI